MRKQLAKALFDLSPVSHKENAYTDFKYSFSLLPNRNGGAGKFLRVLKRQTSEVQTYFLCCMLAREFRTVD